MKKHNLAFVDIETTGLDFTKHEIIEIGYIVTTPDFQVLEEFDLKIKPERIDDADPISLKINHYYERTWEDALSLKEAIKIFTEKVEDCIMVGHNVVFDSEFLDYAFSKSGIKNSMHYHRLDTISLAWSKLSSEPELEHYSLHELCLRFGIKNKNPHTALSDARATFELYKKLAEM